MGYVCWDWCERDHEHNFSSEPVAMATRDVLNTSERDSLELQLGFRPRTRSEAKAAMKDGNFEFVSQSGSEGEFRRDMHEWANEPKDSRGPAPKMRN